MTFYLASKPRTTITKAARPTVIAFLLAAACFFGLMARGQNIPPKPSPPRLVNDLADILTPEQEQHLEEKLVRFDDTTSIQIAVVTIASLEGADVGDYAVELGRKWQVGNKATNNGIVLLISKGDRKVFIAPGYGLESKITDYAAKTIIEREIIPNFKNGSFYRGIEQGVDALMQATQGAYKAPQGYANRGGSGNEGVVAIIIFIIIIIIFVLISSKGGGRGGDTIGRRGYNHRDSLPPFIFFPSGGGIGRSGGGGGGFGGFGGGSFGGGGAGGSW
jgi:uncharacterized protein